MKRLTAMCLAAALCLGLSGCDMWMNGSYYSVTPYQQDSQVANPASMEAQDYDGLLEIIAELVEGGTQSGIVYMPGYAQEDLERYMERAVLGITHNNAIGAYAVDEIHYEIGTSTGRPAIAIDITYNHNRSEILRIKKVQTMEQALNAITDALEKCSAGVVVQVDQFETVDFTQLVEDHVDNHPDVCMELPQVTAAVYPEYGQERVIELSFTYQTSRESLRTMQNYVGPVFAAAVLNVRAEEGESEKFSRMYLFLMERNDYQIETSITPAYSLLRHGVGDSKAVAVVFAQMCRQADLDCRIVSGTRSGEPWVWNLICEDGVYYHVDLLGSVSTGRLHKLTEAEMNGYVWDYSAYPASGTPIDTTE